MRVIRGKYKGKKIDGFGIDGTRPTMDRIKESLFAMIQNNLEDSVCLDLFAGTGSLGIEALSNGAKQCYFVENNSEMTKILRKNLLNIESSTIIEAHYKKAIKSIKTKFDIIFLDPPYHLNIITKAIQDIIDFNLLNNNALIVCEYENEDIMSKLPIIKEKKYGNKHIKIYQYKI